LSIRILAALLIIDLLAFGAHPALAKPSNAPKTVAVVGQTAIPVRDISYMTTATTSFTDFTVRTSFTIAL